MNSKVLVDRELLEYLADLGDEAIERMGSYLAEKHGEQKYVDEARAILAQQPEDERDGLVAARTAYASEFAPDENGDPDVGSIHANIRALKAERDALRKDAERYKWLMRELGGTISRAVTGAPFFSNEAVDEAIDHAMQGEQP